MGRLYIGSTSDLKTRMYQHKTGYFKGSHSDIYDTKMLVYWEAGDSIESAILAERRMKEWKRNWKLRAIIDKNPEWKDLSVELFGF